MFFYEKIVLEKIPITILQLRGRVKGWIEIGTNDLY